jgi:hypothetical protein
MKKLIKFLTSKIKYFVIIYFLFQVSLILLKDVNYKSDALYYFKLAKECIELNEFYPAKQHLYEDYIVAPLYVNTLIFILTVYDSTITISIFNLIIILLQLLLLYKITIKIFSEVTARLTVLIFIFYLNNAGLMLQNYTELLFLLLVSASIYFFLLSKNSCLLLSGIFLGGAISVRPAGWALLLAFIILQFLLSIKNKKVFLNYLYIYSGTLIFILLFGGFTILHFGRFEFTSTTGSVNLLLGANDDATGGFNSKVFGSGKAGYIENPESLTYLEKGDFYREQAFSWISRNPGKWILLAPLKLLHTFGWDDISLSSLPGYDDTNFLQVTKILLSGEALSSALHNAYGIETALYLSTLILSHLYYYLILILIVFGIYNLLRNRLNGNAISLILIFSVLSVLMIMITVGTPRYKYPPFILLLPFAAYYLEIKFGTGKQNIEKN